MPLTETQRLCREQILSQDYADYIVPYGGNVDVTVAVYEPSCYEIINSDFLVMQKPLSDEWLRDIQDEPYSMIPDVLGLLETTSMEQSGILPVHDSPANGYRGRNIMVGIVDTGIDFTHRAFRRSDGSTRILSIWDQTIQSEQAPDTFPYGTLYTQADINRALTSDAPFEVLPTRDENGHGTFMAGIMAGSEDLENAFIGAAPEASIAVVKLKPAKDYLRDFYVIKEDALAFQETDVFMAIQHLIHEALQNRMPLVLCLGIGNSLNSHEGMSNLSQYLNSMNHATGICVTVAAGNELGRAHHYSGYISEIDGSETAELRVGEHERGFQMELWGGLSDVFSVEIISPEGERIRRNPTRFGQALRVRFIFENTEIYIADKSYGLESGRFLTVIQIRNPSPGIWTFRVYGERIVDGHFDIWLPMEQFIQEETYFLSPDPDITLVSQATTLSTLTVANYNHYNDSLYLNSSRGYTTSGMIKPDIAAPGVAVYGPVPGGGYENRTGSSISAAHAAGACALLFEWGLLDNILINMDGNDVRRFIIQGAVQKGGEVFPNRGWGYGALNLKNTFETLRIVR